MDTELGQLIANFRRSSVRPSSLALERMLDAKSRGDADQATRCLIAAILLCRASDPGADRSRPVRKGRGRPARMPFIHRLWLFCGGQLVVGWAIFELLRMEGWSV